MRIGGQDLRQASADGVAETGAARRERRYRPPLAARLGIAFALLVLAATDGLGVAAGGVALISFLFVATVWLAWLGVHVLKTGGITATSTGIRSRRLVWGYDHARWEEIERFRAARSRVYVVMRTGAARPLVGVAQGALTKWEGGETRDIVGELNGHLREWRHEQEQGGASAERSQRPA